MSGVKYITPPLKDVGRSTWSEDKAYRRWTNAMRKEMHHGTYDWAKHTEKTV